MMTQINNEKGTHRFDIETQMETIRKGSRSCFFGNIQLLLLSDLFCCRDNERSMIIKILATENVS